jgi:hypothetical protein
MMLNRHFETRFNQHTFLTSPPNSLSSCNKCSAHISTPPTDSQVPGRIPALTNQKTRIAAAESKPKIKFRSGNKDFPERKSLKSLSVTPILQIQKIASIGIPQNTAEYSKPAYNFMIRTLKPIKGCLLNHFNGDVNAFFQKWKSLNGTFPYSRFSDKCKGLGNICF